MTQLTDVITRIALIGIGATATMDAWLWLLKRAGVPTLNFALMGRWVGHMGQGRWAHQAISRAAPVRGEAALGWTTHYLVGIVFAALLVAVLGTEWTRDPQLASALCVGIATVIAPWFVMQPAMGAGIASSRTANPVRNCLRNLANHAVFGAGLYLSAVAVGRVLR